VTKGGINAKQVIIIITIICCVPSQFAFIQQRGEATFHQLIFGHTFLTHRIVLLSSAEHNLPDSPFASPTKSTAAFAHDPFAPTESEIAAAASPGRNAASFAGISNGGLTSHLRPSALDIPSPKPYFFPMSRLSSDHGAGAIGM
jgi:hypothetical protein